MFNYVKSYLSILWLSLTSTVFSKIASSIIFFLGIFDLLFDNSMPELFSMLAWYWWIIFLLFYFFLSILEYANKQKIEIKNLINNEREEKESTPCKIFKKWITKRFGKGHALLNKDSFEYKEMSIWHKRTVDGVKIAFGGKIDYEEIASSISFMETSMKPLILYDNSANTKEFKEVLDNCLSQIVLILMEVQPYMLSDKFNPKDLPE